MTNMLVLLSDVLVHATPLIVTGLAVAIAFRAGVWNIGADGQFMAGAVLATLVAVGFGARFGARFGPISLVFALGAGSMGGALWAGVAALLRARFGVLDVISTIMLNFVATYGLSYLVRGPLQESTHVYPQTESIPGWSRLPTLIPGTRLHWGFVMAVALAAALWWIVTRTAAGFRLRAVGANPFAARSAGMIRVKRVTSEAFIASGAVAGLAGAIQVCGVTFALYENISPGYGYTAIAVALLAGLHPLGIMIAGIFFGALETGASALQRNAAVPATLAAVVEALSILLVIAVAQLRSRRGAGD